MHKQIIILWWRPRNFLVVYIFPSSCSVFVCVSLAYLLRIRRMSLPPKRKQTNKKAHTTARAPQPRRPVLTVKSPAEVTSHASLHLRSSSSTHSLCSFFRKRKIHFVQISILSCPIRSQRPEERRSPPYLPRPSFALAFLSLFVPAVLFSLLSSYSSTATTKPQNYFHFREVFFLSNRSLTRKWPEEKKK